MLLELMSLELMSWVSNAMGAEARTGAVTTRADATGADELGLNAMGAETNTGVFAAGADATGADELVLNSMGAEARMGAVLELIMQVGLRQLEPKHCKMARLQLVLCWKLK
jgi:hypothetical protein